MICVPLDDVEDVLQRRLDAMRQAYDGYAVVVLARAVLLCVIDELTALQVDTEAPACPECGDPLPAKSTHCFDCWMELNNG